MIQPALPFCRYTLTVRALDPLRLPPFAGSMLRGAFGHALRQLACITRKDDCSQCPLQMTCAYAQIFETPPLAHLTLKNLSAMPNPYVVEPPEHPGKGLQAGDVFRFSMVLMGKALAQLPLIFLAWERALDHGLGKYRHRCQLIGVQCETDSETIYQPGSKVATHIFPSVKPPPVDGRLTLEFTTPLRLRKAGANVGIRELDARTLLINLARRYQLLCDSQLQNPGQLDFAGLDRSARQIELQADMSWLDWSRYSNRQRQSMPMGGLVGRLTLTGDLTPFVDLLYMGQWIHVGKEAVFGLGRYLVH